MTQHQDRESQKMQSGERFGQSFVVTGQTAEAGRPSETALDHPAARQQDKALLGTGQAHHFQLKAVGVGRLCRLVTGIALVDKGYLDRVTCYVLHLGRQARDLRAILFVCRRDMQGQQIAQRIDRQMSCVALASSGAIVARPHPTFRRGLQRATVENGLQRLGVAPLRQAQQHA